MEHIPKEELPKSPQQASGDKATETTSKSYYILFPNHTEGLGLYSFLKKQDLKVRISPTPREAASCCGMSLLVNETEIEQVRAAIPSSGFTIEKIVELNNQIDPRRNVFC